MQHKATFYATTSHPFLKRQQEGSLTKMQRTTIPPVKLKQAVLPSADAHLAQEQDAWNQDERDDGEAPKQ